MSRATTTSRARAFTLIELLVVIVIIGALLGIILVAVSGVFSQSRTTAVANTLATISTGAEAFKNDFGAHPPLLTYEDSMWEIGETPTDSIAEQGVIVPTALQGPPNDRAVQALRRARYASEYTVGVYLLGAGDLNTKVGDHTSVPSPMGASRQNQGGNTDDDDGLAGAGIRAPGPDLSWGGASDRSRHRANKLGRSYGPYIDPARLGDSLVLEPESGLFKIVDAWNQPVRYYKSWPVRNESGTSSSVARTPVELRTERAVAEHILEGQAKLDLELEALNAPFMLVSAGEPRFFEPDGTPRPQFGATRPPPNESTKFQNLSADFEPDQLAEQQQEELLEALRTNIRVTR